MKRILTYAFCVVFAVTACKKGTGETATGTAAGTTTATAATATPADEIVMHINGQPVMLSEFNAAVESLPANIRAQATASNEGKKQVAEELVRMKLLAAEGARIGVDKEPKVVKEVAMMRDNVIASATIEKLAQSGGPADLQKAYNNNKNSFSRVHVKQILVAYPGSLAKPKNGKQLSDEQARAKADALLAKLRGGAKFETLAKAESDDPGSGPRGGDLGYLTGGQAPPEIESIIFNMPLNTLIEPVKTAAGYHIFLAIEKQSKTFDEVKDQLQQQSPQIKARQIVTDMRTKAKVEFDPKFFGPQTTTTSQP